MKIYSGLEATELRFLFIDSFIDVSSDYYIHYIHKKAKYSDGLHYSGYLWDCLKNKRSISFASVVNILENSQQSTYILWDDHSSDNIRISNYWKYPRNSILVAEPKEIRNLISSLPEDCYFFDNSLSCAYAITHEEQKQGKRLCYVSNIQV